jgi:hypothetical protein
MEINMVFADESSAYAQAAHADEVYMTGATGLPVQDDHDARVTMANATHTVVANEDLATELNSTTVALPHINAEVYTGGNLVTVAENRAGVDAYPEDTQDTEDLEQEVLVSAALVADALFDRGGFIGAYYAGGYSPYVDGAWLAEASKQTGEKFF